MREIKFRAWDKREKTMRSVLNLFTNGHVYVDCNCDAEGQFKYHRDKSRTGLEHHLSSGDIALMQFTGLKDKNGKEVYEGDIVDAVSAGSRCKGVITWGIAGFFIKIPPPQSIWHFGVDSEKREDVIGNIYENPELS